MDLDFMRKIVRKMRLYLNG